MMKKQKIIDKTRKDYNLIGDHFSATRNSFWKEFQFLFDVPAGAKVLDLGCGNGRFYPLLKQRNVDYVGVDISEKLIQKATQKYPEAKFLVRDALDLRFENEFDFIFSIAVFHHIPDQHSREKFLQQAAKALKNNGELRLSVWNLMEYNKSLLFNSWKDKMLGRLHLRDTFIPWKNSKREIVTKRYYHFFTVKELKSLFTKSALTLEKIFKKGKGAKSNIFVFATKKNDSLY